MRSLHVYLLGISRTDPTMMHRDVAKPAALSGTGEATVASPLLIGEDVGLRLNTFPSLHRGGTHDVPTSLCGSPRCPGVSGWRTDSWGNSPGTSAYRTGLPPYGTRFNGAPANYEHLALMKRRHESVCGGGAESYTLPCWNPPKLSGRQGDCEYLLLPI